jgi:septum formation protein
LDILELPSKTARLRLSRRFQAGSIVGRPASASLSQLACPPFVLQGHRGAVSFPVGTRYLIPDMPSPALILASASRSRRQLLANAGLAFEMEVSGVDEEETTRSLVARRAPPGEIAEALAEMKALRVSSRHRDALVIGADSTLACEGRLFDKPATLAAAREQLLALGGRTHQLFSSVVVAKGGVRLWHHTDCGQLIMRPFDKAFVDSYLARAGEAVLSSVGAYHLEGLGAHLFSRVEGDYFNILGLPLLPLLSFLAEHGIGLEKAT